MNGVEQDPHGPGKGPEQKRSAAWILSPWQVLIAARKAVPAVDYALGIAGLAAAAAFIMRLLGRTHASIILLGLLFIGMVLLFAFSRLVIAKSKSIQIAGAVLLWAVMLFFLSFLGFTVTAFALSPPWPKPWANFLGLTHTSPTPTVNRSAIRTAIANLNRILVTLPPFTAGNTPFGGTLHVSLNGAAPQVTYACAADAPCPKGTIGEATSEFLTPNLYVRWPNSLQALHVPGFHRYLLLDSAILGQRNRTQTQEQIGLTTSDPKHLTALFDQARTACNLQSKEEDKVIQQVVDLRGLEANALFWTGDAGAPPKMTRWHLLPFSSMPSFGSYIIRIAESAGLTYSQVDTATVSSITQLIDAQYQESYNSVKLFVHVCQTHLKH